MKNIELIITHPLFAAVLGFLAYNIVRLSIYKDANEKKWHWRSYKNKEWDNWLGSLIFVPIMLFIGYKGLGLGMIDMGSSGMEWSDLYYLCSGFAYQAVKNYIKKKQEL